MIGLQYSGCGFPEKGVLEVSGFGSSSDAAAALIKFKKDGSFGSSSNEEPISVLDKRRSPSPSTSTSASSSSFCGTAAAAAAPKEELQPLPVGFEVGGCGGENLGFGLEDWESFLIESGVSDQSLFPWSSGEFEDPAEEIHGNVGFGGNFLSSCSHMGNFFTFNSNSNNGKFGSVLNSFDNVLPPLKPQSFNFYASMDQTQTQNSAVPTFGDILEEDLPPSKRPNLQILNSIPASPRPEIPLGYRIFGSGPFSGLFQPPSPSPLLIPKQEANLMSPPPNQQQQLVVYDQVYKAAELIQKGQFSHAQMILARLNHNQPSGEPVQRAVSCFKEALALPPKLPSQVDFVLKMGAYKVFSEASPLLQFMNFTSNQTLLEAVGGAGSVHVFDFDIGFGAQWSSFMEELPKKKGGAASLKITAFGSPSTHHPVEINLMHESLSQFANDVGVRFELEMINLDTFDPSSSAPASFRQSEDEVIVVNFPIWSLSNRLPVLPSLLHYIKRLSPKIVVSLDRGCERADLPVPHHILNALKYYEVLLESIGAAKVTLEAGDKMERFIFQPSIESIVQGRLNFPDQMPPWRALFASAGFLPAELSGLAETQAECVVKRNLTGGFHVERRQMSLVLCWQRRELLTATAWRC